MRIIAGEHKGRVLRAPKGLGTRPITDRVKTALFNILAGRIAGAAVADLFAGTGTIGLEALSRGARRCWFAERDRGAVAGLRANIAAMRLAEKCLVWRGDVFRHLPDWLAETHEALDLAFIDPPYDLVDRWRWDQAGERLFAPLAEHLADDGLAMFRCQRNIRLPETLGPLCVRDRRDYGKMSLVFLAPADRPTPSGQRM